MPECKLAIFDCDGTLMDSELIIAEEETAALAEIGIKIDPRTFLRRFAGYSGDAVRAGLEEEWNRHLPDDYDAQVPRRVEERLRREVKALPGVHAMLDRLDQPRCICSNSGIKRLEVELRRAELWDRFRPYVFSARDLDGIQEKPAPDVFLHAAREFDAEPERCVVVEDSISGVSAGREAGMRVIGFTGGSHTYPGHADALIEAGAETVINRLYDVPQLIEVFSKWEGLTD